MEQNSDYSDLIPKGLGIYWLFFLAGAALIGLLGYAYFKLQDLTQLIGIESLAFLDLAEPTCLLAWCVSSLLLATVCITWFNSRLARKYKDPLSKRINWSWAGIALILLSLDVQVPIRATIRDVLVRFSGATIYQDGTIWALTIYVFFFGIIACRLLSELISYLPALGLYLIAVAGALTGLLIQGSVLPKFASETEMVLIQNMCTATAALMLFLSFALYARRQVLRDPQIALRWFAKVWNQPEILQHEKTLAEIKKETSAPPVEKPVAKVELSTEKKPMSQTSSSSSPASAASLTSSSSGASTPASLTTTSTLTSTEVQNLIKLENQEKKEDKNSDFDLGRSA